MVPRAREPMLWDSIGIIQIAYELYGDWEDVCSWLLKPHELLGGVRPVELLDTEEGCAKVYELFDRLKSGGYA